MTRKGVILPGSRWRLPGDVEPSVRLDCGRLGRGPMHAEIRGERVLTFPKPMRGRGAVVSPPHDVGGHEMVIYAESFDRGNSVTCDVYFDGISLTSGEPVSRIGGRVKVSLENDREAALAEPLRLSRMALVQAAWFVPAGVSARMAFVSGRTAVVPGVAYTVMALVISVALYLCIRRVKPDDPHVRLKAFLVPVASVVLQSLLGVAFLSLATGSR
jgi:hypothetical protein